ncbi:hypothetical protein K493DRAFT_341854 [Basidiobolus meristosporus CBS 931.73]|uniref:VLRF1 domain-containing protein n=1 Tax=Basidiobolus meristosporus CBS 931.73 TaxID=1314790 RepID=A0A1Y1XGU3_9FUNG|nr:hypothetical protein K493DRAFT_341854 [Basidiobolus meristosporus CBS 931.73]|eukprot:ORX84980.1 hypothetical protein K493DRAFT_341854 [Basidiobolus meristosporus CBS 931.73]
MTAHFNLKDLSVFSIPKPLLKELQPCKILENFHQLSEKASSSDEECDQPDLSKLQIGTSLTCATCGGVRFESVEEQREHVRLDWHRYNLKRKTLEGFSGPITEEEFEYMIADLSSISGSSSDEYDSESEEEEVDLLLKKHEKAVIQDNQAETPTAQKVRKGIFQLPIVWFETPSLGEHKRLGIYKSVLSDTKDSLDDITADQLSNLVATLQIDKPKLSKASVWTLMMMGGGHFAFAVFDNGYDGKVLFHRTYHRYTTRRQQGGSQSRNDQAKGKARSAGASMRRENELKLQKEIRDLMVECKDYLHRSSRIYTHVSVANKNVLFNYEDSVLKADDPRVRKFPFSTHRPTFNELKRAYKELVTAKIAEIPEEILNFQASTVTPTSVATEPTPVTTNHEALEEPIDEVDPLLDIKTKAISSIRKGKMAIFKNLLAKHPELTVTADLSALEPKYPTFLHLASFESRPDFVTYLIKNGANPATPALYGKTPKVPYDVAKDKNTRNAFRRLMADYPNEWDWKAAHVPSPLTKEMLEEQERKEHEREERKRKELEKQHQKLDAGKSAEKPSKEKETPLKTTTNSSRRLDGGRLKPDATRNVVGTMTPEVRARLERERRARAAEMRMAALASQPPTGNPSSNGCAYCSGSLAGKVPFEALGKKFCSTKCVSEYRKQ